MAPHVLPDPLAPAVTPPASAEPLSFPALLQQLHDRRFTGQITLHFFSGTPTSVDFPQRPRNVRLDRPTKARKTLG